MDCCNIHAEPTPTFDQGGGAPPAAAGIATEVGQVIETETGQQIQPG